MLPPSLSRTLLVSALIVLLPTRGFAQKTDDSVYEESVSAAVQEFNRGNWEEAQALFRRAHNVSPNARTWRSLGVCAFELRQYVEATADLEAALVDPRKPLTDEQRSEVQNLLTRAREFVSTYHVRVTPNNAEVVVDGKPVSLRGDTLHLDPGPHSIVVRARGYQERREDFRAPAGVQDELSIQLSLANQGGENEPRLSQSKTQDASAPPEPSKKKRKIWTWSLAGASVAAAAVAIGLRVSAQHEHDNYEHCTASAESTDCQRFKSSGLTRLHASYGVAGAAAALFVGATVSYFVEGKRTSEQRTARFQLGPQGVTLHGTF